MGQNCCCAHYRVPARNFAEYGLMAVIAENGSTGLRCTFILSLMSSCDHAESPRKLTTMTFKTRSEMCSAVPGPALSEL